MKVLIAEDEAPAARRLERMVGEHLPGARFVLAATVEAAREALAAEKFDLLLLDLDLNGADGFALVGAGAPRIVVVSARADRAIDAFDHAVADFVTKPVSAARLAKALDRALAPVAAPAPRGPASLAVRSAGRIDLAAFADIVALSGADDYVEVVLADGRRFLHDTRLQELEARLPPGFIRVHRSHIANTAHIRSVRTLPGRRRALVLTGGTEIPVSRSRLGTVEAVVGG